MLVGLSIFGRKKKEENGGEGQPSIIHSLRRAANELRDKKREKSFFAWGLERYT